MPIVRVLTSSGEVPHNLLDGQVNQDTLAGSVVRGDLIVGNSTPKWARLGIGAGGTVLTSDGTDASWVAPSGATPATVKVFNLKAFW